MSGSFSHSDGVNPFGDRPSEPAFNPYAPPQLTGQMSAIVNFDGVWREGKLLVMHRLARLPDFCVKTNEPTPLRLTRKLVWTPPWVIIMFIISPLIYVIVALIVQRKATIEIGVSESRLSRRRWTMLISWVAALCGLAIMALGFGQQGGAALAFILAGLGIAFVAAIAGAALCPLVSAAKIDGDYLFIKGAHPDYLARFPSLS